MFRGLYSYLVKGQASTPLPTIRLGDAEYLASVHMSMTPFGTETIWENYFVKDEVLYRLRLGFGDESFNRDWGRLGLLISNPFARGSYSMDLYLDAWKQPAMILGDGFVSRGGDLGAAVSLRNYFSQAVGSRDLKAVLEFGYKTAGYLEGYSLDRVIILLAGVQL
jgi:hypothetical protein